MTIVTDEKNWVDENGVKHTSCTILGFEPVSMPSCLDILYQTYLDCSKKSVLKPSKSQLRKLFQNGSVHWEPYLHAGKERVNWDTTMREGVWWLTKKKLLTCKYESGQWVCEIDRFFGGMPW